MIEVATTTLELRVKDASNPIHIPALKAKRPKVITKRERDAANAKALKADQLTCLIKRLQEIPGIRLLAFESRDSLGKQHDVILTKMVNRQITQVLNQNGFNPFSKVTEDKVHLFIYADVIEKQLSVAEIHKLSAQQQQFKEQGIIYIKSTDINQIIRNIEGLS